MIHRAQHDVPVFTPQDLWNSDASSDQTFAASYFVALATLTEVLGRCLKQVYNLERDFSKVQESSPFDLEILLAKWEDSLNDELRRLVIRGTRLIGPGAAKLI
jgi:hypothetical protein